ncbi:hypothetical protein EP867_13910 [Falsigemmobacter intermedius]|uniref:Energy transducer TonB n=1 Tax=Falsigemmobacter intermedius TaxID=1553448 RepID=A0A3S3UDH9_9RHOB|nr:hypothetical protein EP867_13910 [Falsigemmobacter intermedius]
MGSASTDAMSSVIELRAHMRPDGGVERVEMLSANGPSEAGNRTAYETARRAVMRCAQNGALPADKYEQWQQIDMTFDYNAMRLR